jgi:hypothetical protein
MLKFLRRDPTVWIGLIQGALGVALAFHLFGLTDALVPLIMAVINGAAGVITAILTKRSGFSVAMGLIVAGINLFSGYGLTLDDAQTAAIMLFAPLVLGLFGWTQNSPADQPGMSEEPMPSSGPVINQYLPSAVDVDESSPYTPPSVGGTGGF